MKTAVEKKALSQSGMASPRGTGIEKSERTAKASVADAPNARKAASNELAAPTRTIKQMQDDLRAARELAQSLRADLTSQQDLATSERARRDAIIADLTTEIARTRDRIEQDATRLDALHMRNAELERLSASIAHLEESRTAERYAYASAQETVDAYKARLETAIANLRSTESALATALRERDAAEVALSFAERGLRERDKRVAALDADVRATRALLSSNNIILEERAVALAVAEGRLHIAYAEHAAQDERQRQDLFHLSAERDRLVTERDQAIAERDHAIAERNTPHPGFIRRLSTLFKKRGGKQDRNEKNADTLAAADTPIAVSDEHHEPEPWRDEPQPWLEIHTSPSFNAAWYLENNPDVAAANLDPARHYFEHGAAEGRDPGPVFSTTAYVRLNPELRSSGENPIIHALRSSADQAQLSISEIRSHPLFDAAWYLQRYPDVAASDDDPAGHYATLGGAERRDPSLLFSTSAYLDANPDVAEAGDNALLHYIRTGAAEGRPISPVLTEHQAKQARAIGAHRFFNAKYYTRRQPDAAAYHHPEDHFLLVGGPLRVDPGPRFKSSWYIRSNRDVAQSGVIPFLHYVEQGEQEGRAATPTTPLLENLILPSRQRTARPMLAGEAMRHLVSGVANAVGRLRPRAQPVAAPDQDLPDGETTAGWQIFRHLYDLPGHQPARQKIAERVKALDREAMLCDIWFANKHELRLRIDIASDSNDAPVQLSAYQASEGVLYLCGELSVGGEGPQFFSFQMVNPFMPVLLVVVDRSGARRDVLLPFPSLFRGGAHHGEAALRAAQTNRFAEIEELATALLIELLAPTTRAFSISSIEIAAAGAIGTEHIFSRQAIEWLSTIMRVQIGLNGADAALNFADLLITGSRSKGLTQAAVDRARKGGATLILPASSLPTIGALVSRDARHIPSEAMITSFIVADAVDNRPKCVARLPIGSGTGLELLQPKNLTVPVLRPKNGKGRTKLTTVPLPMAIRFDSGRLAPSALLLRSTDMAITSDGEGPRNSAPVAIAISFSEIQRLERLLASLVEQTHSSRFEIFVIDDDVTSAFAAEIQAAIDAYFPNRGSLAALAQLCTKESPVMFVGDELMLQDPNIFAALETLVDTPHTASAGCLQLSIGSDKNGTIKPFSSGIFPSHRDGHPLALSDQNHFDAFPASVYPTAGNSFRLALVSATAWARFGTEIAAAPQEARAVYFAGISMAAGFRHLATSAVTAALHTPGGGDDRAVTTGETPSNWIEVPGGLPEIMMLTA